MLLQKGTVQTKYQKRSVANIINRQSAVVHRHDRSRRPQFTGSVTRPREIVAPVAVLGYDDDAPLKVVHYHQVSLGVEHGIRNRRERFPFLAFDISDGEYIFSCCYDGHIVGQFLLG